MKFWTIYCHQHIESGRRYIGLTSQTMMQRWNQHVSKSKNSKGGRWHFPNAIRKYGPEAFSHEVLAMSSNLEDANMTEEALIEQYQTRDPSKGFNLAKGGSYTPGVRSKEPYRAIEFRDKISTIVKSRWNNPSYRNVCLKNINSEESRAKSQESRSTSEFRLKMSLMKKDSSHTRETCEKLSKIGMGRINRRESVEKMVQTHISYTEVDGKVTNKLCKKHGIVPVSQCYVKIGKLKFIVECRFCMREAKKSRKLMNRVLSSE